MSSIFELHARVRRLRGALSHLKTNMLREADRLRDALRAGTDVETGAEWAALVCELREFATLAEALATARASQPETSRRSAAAANLCEPIATYH